MKHVENSRLIQTLVWRNSQLSWERTQADDKRNLDKLAYEHRIDTLEKELKRLLDNTEFSEGVDCEQLKVDSIILRDENKILKHKYKQLAASKWATGVVFACSLLMMGIAILG